MRDIILVQASEITRVLIITLTAVGIFISLYFTLAFYTRVKESRWIPQILCAPQGSSCATVVQTPYARIFSVPNSLVGIVFYLAILIWLPWTSDVHFQEEHLWLVLGWTGALILGSAASVILGFYLMNALRHILRTDCPLCYTAHAINALLLLLLILRTLWML
ncbi:MAG: vitamin K epoxide reductase family protein [Terriglobia bacterium]